MNVYLTGSSGLIGRPLIRMLEESGHRVFRIVRRPARNDQERTWNPEDPQPRPDLLDGCDVLVHLAGENIGDGSWTNERKRRILDSRVVSTQLLSDSIVLSPRPPQAFIVASGSGYYGDRGDEILTEASEPGMGFLSDVCQAWEAAADRARHVTRVVHVRTGMVLSRDGGALPKLLTPFRWGVGGVMGNGKQWWSWISLQDIVRLFHFAAETESLTGPVNGVSPDPATNRQFVKVLAEVLHRPAIFPAPAFALRLALGEMADELILASVRALPEAAMREGFTFLHGDLKQALEA